MTQKPRLLVVIGSDLYVRNYLKTDALAKLEERFECGYIALDSITLRDEVERKPGFAGYFRTDPASVKRQFNLLNVLTWRYRKRSSSFYFRFLRLCGADLLQWRSNPLQFLLNVLRFVYRNLVRDRWPLCCVLFGSRLVFPGFVKFYTRGIPLNLELVDIIRRLSPDLLLFPSSAYDPAGNDVIRAAHELGKKTFFVIDNWDNLSSKSIFWVRPDYVGVWGIQSKEHAVRMHDIPPSRVFVIGTPRLDQYSRARGRALSSHFDFEYVLFVGCAIPFDEVTALRMLDREISEHPEVYGKLRVVYRPHPWRQPRGGGDRFAEDGHTVVTIDPQIRAAYYGVGATRIGESGFQPDLAYYPSLLGNARFVVGPLTTMVVEALAMNREVLALAYDDGVHFTSPHNAYRYYEHFRGLENVEGMTFCWKAESLGQVFRQLYREKRLLDETKQRKDLEYFVHESPRPYPERLCGAIEECLAT